MSLLQKTIAELRELQHEEIELVGGGGGPTGESTYCPSSSWIQTPVGPSFVNDDGSGDSSPDWAF
ncbi:MAG TPA: hypothetical protein VEW08_17450 [Steroidobacteraceae bacterium]|nr:hypothetical protein [Steroidobacteraceae bacterium]